MEDSKMNTCSTVRSTTPLPSLFNMYPVRELFEGTCIYVVPTLARYPSTSTERFPRVFSLSRKVVPHTPHPSLSLGGKQEPS